MKFSEITLALGLLFSPAFALAAKTDIVILNNGDRVTGEIKKLEAGLLEFKTDTMGTVNIEWRFISEIISDTSHALEITDGARVLGTLNKPANGHHVLVGTIHGPVDVQPEQIVSVWPVEATFTDRMELDLSFGLEFEKATDTTDSNAAVDFRLRDDDRLTEASLRSNVTRRPGSDDQTRWELDAFHEYLLEDQRFRNWFGKVESNDATGVNLRLSGGGAFGKYLVKTNNKWLTVSAGLSAIQENPQSAGSETNIEAVGSLRYRYFRYADPERSFDTTFNIYPSLTDSGRVRADLRSTFKLEMVEDLFWSLELYATHDNEPLSEGADKADYGFITSVGWSY
jgi:hypothetical protein